MKNFALYAERAYRLYVFSFFDELGVKRLGALILAWL